MMDIWLIDFWPMEPSQQQANTSLDSTSGSFRRTTGEQYFAVWGWVRVICQGWEIIRESSNSGLRFQSGLEQSERCLCFGGALPHLALCFSHNECLIIDEFSVGNRGACVTAAS